MRKRYGLTWRHWVTIGIVAAQITPATAVHASSFLSLQDAIRSSVEASAELKDLRQVQLKQADFELAQAYQALRNQEAMDNSNKAKEHSMSRDIELGMKVPGAQGNKKKIQRQLDDKTGKQQVQTEQAYMQAYQQQANADSAKESRDKAQQSLQDLRTKQKFGYATQDDVKAAEQLLAQAESTYKTAQLSFTTSRLALAQLVGKPELEGDTRFDLPRVYAVLNQDTMWKLYESAKGSDYDLFQDTEARRLAETKVGVIRSLYVAKFGQQATDLLAAVYDPPKEANYDKFLEEYDKLVANLQARWKGKALVLTLSFPFLKVVPKVELQGEYQDDRYFEDLSTSLPLALLDLDKAKLKEADTRNKLLTKIKNAYLTAKQAEESYLQSLQNEENVRIATEAAATKLKFGQITALDLDKQQGVYIQAKQATLSSYIAYKGALSTLNLASGGALPYLSGVPKTAGESGNEPFDNSKATSPKNMGTWSVQGVAGNLTSKFSLLLPSGTQVTHYALRFKQGGNLIGEKTPIQGALVHLSLVFQDPSLLEVVLYDGDKQVAVANLDGYAPAGSLSESPSP